MEDLCLQLVTTRVTDQLIVTGNATMALAAFWIRVLLYSISGSFVWKLSKFEERMWKITFSKENFIYWLLKPNVL